MTKERKSEIPKERKNERTATRHISRAKGKRYTGNKKETYKIVNQLMDRDLSKNIRPNHKPDSIICEEMKTYFKEKVEKIYTDIENEAMDSKDIPIQELTPDYKGDKWEKFMPISEEMLRSVLSDLNTKELFV